MAVSAFQGISSFIDPIKYKKQKLNLTKVMISN